jgi:WD40 repeat protein
MSAFFCLTISSAALLEEIAMLRTVSAGTIGAVAAIVVAFLVVATPAKVFSVAFFPDGKRIASASQDGTLRIWGAPR